MFSFVHDRPFVSCLSLTNCRASLCNACNQAIATTNHPQELGLMVYPASALLGTWPLSQQITFKQLGLMDYPASALLATWPLPQLITPKQPELMTVLATRLLPQQIPLNRLKIMVCQTILASVLLATRPLL